MMTFAEYVELDEGVLNNPVTEALTKWLVDFLKSTWVASRDQYRDTIQAVQVLKSKLASILGSHQPTEQELQAAMRAITDLPKIGTVIVSLVAPIPGVFMAIMIIAVAMKRAFNISILPTHFDKAYLNQNTWMGKMASKKPVE